MSVIIREDNTEEIEAALESGIQRALEKIGLTAEGYAKKAAPVDTGRLRNPITHVVDNGEKSVEVGTNVEYAKYQELGTSTHAAANDGKGFLRPAATEHVDKFEYQSECHCSKTQIGYRWYTSGLNTSQNVTAPKP